MAQQRSLYAAYLAGRGNLAARPGYSNHQGGLSVDVATNSSYSSASYRWLARNARNYGFVNDVRGEPWHWTYRG
jgi:LAS superfamily LD-carboxypeptidase LdcB